MKKFTFPKRSLASIQPQTLLLELTSLIHKVIPLNPRDLLRLNFHWLIHVPRNYFPGIALHWGLWARERWSGLQPWGAHSPGSLRNRHDHTHGRLRKLQGYHRLPLLRGRGCRYRWLHCSTSCTSGHHLLQTFPYTLWHHRPGVSRTISRKPVSRRQLRPTLCSMYVTGPESSIVTLLCVTRAVAPKSCGLVSWGPGPSRGLLRQNSAGSSQTWGFNNRT